MLHAGRHARLITTFGRVWKFQRCCTCTASYPVHQQTAGDPLVRSGPAAPPERHLQYLRRDPARPRAPRPKPAYCICKAAPGRTDPTDPCPLHDEGAGLHHHQSAALSPGVRVALLVTSRHSSKLHQAVNLSGIAPERAVRGDRLGIQATADTDPPLVLRRP